MGSYMGLKWLRNDSKPISVLLVPFPNPNKWGGLCQEGHLCYCFLTKEKERAEGRKEGGGESREGAARQEGKGEDLRGGMCRGLV